MTPLQKLLRDEVTGGSVLDRMESTNVESIDFNKKIYPLRHFINNREAMLNEMFSIINEDKLFKILPPALKDCSVEVLKADCLVHLLGMSKKRILAVMEGRVLNSSSESETEDEETVPYVHHTNNDTTIRKSNDKKNSKTQNQNHSEISSIILLSDDDDKPKPKQMTVKENKKSSKHKKKTKRRKKSSETDKLAEEQKIVPSANSSKNTNGDNKDDKGKSLLEILELEMRARAIRALLKKSNNKIENKRRKICKNANDVANIIDKTISNVEKQIESDVDDIEIQEDCLETVIIDDDDDDDDDDAVMTKNNESMSNNQNEKSQEDKSENMVSELTVEKEDSLVYKLNDEAPQFIVQKENSVVGKLNIATTRSTDENEVSVEPENTELDASPQDIDLNADLSIIFVSDGEDDDPIHNNTCSNESNLNESTENSDNHITWTERWAKSKNVKNIVKDSKLQATVRKRMRFARLVKLKEMNDKGKNINENEAKLLSQLSTVEESSVAQFNLLKSLDTNKSEINEKNLKEEPRSENNTCVDLNEPTIPSTCNDDVTSETKSPGLTISFKEEQTVNEIELPRESNSTKSSEKKESQNG